MWIYKRVYQYTAVNDSLRLEVSLQLLLIPVGALATDIVWYNWKLDLKFKRFLSFLIWKTLLEQESQGAKIFQNYILLVEAQAHFGETDE